ncbi:aggregation-promoting factor C-terminal-like domain-containing protein [Nocardioides bizhenqiangii]|uniref:Lytic transglycosylase domain-containing protein n=1 Tax=Nocardioides bizhenqiangii TaxID=3095076 RepID=A0ABZ0ZNM2_9ACTN|nr:lytic transglycosylase domain-containing protein [Nocardioides sp. HM61]WQQ25818.1 lytic transglycosylase domain-containing protein [Nocardioides sp. HM61]
MSNHAKPAPKHRGNPRHAHLKEAPKRAARNTVILSGVALAVTGITIGGGMLGKGGAQVPGATADIDSAVGDLKADVDAADTGARLPVVSRNDRRGSADPAKQAAMSPTEAAAVTESEQLSDSDPRDIARALMGDFGFSQDQFGCLDSLWTRESNWNVYADNPTSSAYGIPQSLPGEKMASAGSDWATNPVTQITWGLGYIRDRYGSPCSAWGHSESVGWY